MSRKSNWTLHWLKSDFQINMSLKVGITGGIGAGKSLISGIFETFGIPVFNADIEAKKLMNENPILITGMKKLFGQDIYQDGRLNRSLLAQQLFADEHKRMKVNALVHPVVIDTYELWIKNQTHQPYSIKEAALLFEAGSYKDLDKIILVYAPKKIRINRILMRDAYRSTSDIESIIEKQWTDNQKKKLSDYIIINDEQQMVIPQVLDIHEKILKEIE